jgi:Type VI secretion system/phage-baseplate injector OB domain
MEYPEYHGNYVGIVVQNNDPQYRGRVKVFVPHISPTVYKNWIENSTDVKATDKIFKFLGSNIGSPLTDVIEDLKLILPWAEVSSPIAGESTMGRYHASSQLATTSDGSNRAYLYGSEQTSYAQNSDNISEKPGHIFDMATVNLSDAFNTPQLTNVNNVNKLSYNYTPECYSNSGKGSFAIPNVGAHVWVFFNAGDPLKPVVFGVSHGAADWCSVYDASPNNPGLDYPGEYENTAISSETINADTYRNKYVINQKGGTLAFVNTDNREILKMTHYSGSFKEFNNQANIELAVNNDQKLVLGDSFDTVRGGRNVFTQRDFDNVIAGDHYRKVGDLNASLYQQWKAIMDPIADIKQLFDIRRTDGMHEKVASLLKLNGSGQSKSGNPSLCPTCAGGDTNLALNNSFAPGYRAWANVAHAQAIGGDTVGKTNIFMIPTWGRGAELIPGGPFNFITGLIQQFVGSSPLQILANLPLIGSDGSILQNRPGYPSGGSCPTCGGTGQSPSSFNGVWAIETKKLDLPNKMIEAIPKLAKIEAQMGLGGSEIIEITKHKVETIGTVMNDWGAVRVDPAGKIEPAYCQVQPGATIVARKETPLIEQVQVDDLPGGTYTLNVCNRYSVLVGAGGLNLKSYGVVNISGAMTNVTGEQVNVGSANEVNIDGGKRLSLVGDVVHIKQRYGEQVLLDGDVGITGKLIVRGGVYIEGNLAAQQTDTPQRKKQSDPTIVSGSSVSDMCTGVGMPVDTCGYVNDPVTRELKPSYGAGIPVHMGYTDPGRYVGFTPTLTQTGCMPVDFTATVTGLVAEGLFAGEVPVTGTITIPIALVTVTSATPEPMPDAPIFTDTGFCVAGTGPIGETGTLQYIPAQLVPPQNPVATPISQDISSQITLRGLPTAEVTKLVAAASVPLSDGAVGFPIMNFGTGTHADAHVMSKHTHSYDEGEVGSHAAIRMIGMGPMAATSNTDFDEVTVLKSPVTSAVTSMIA